ncbi:MAG: flavin reductase family protein [Spirochaetaceae bacterium]|nr:MAG: flavin reductase family protein [Spirochaetaceae bacterium]
MKAIDPRELSLAPIRQLLDDWMLLTAGSEAEGDFNMMTVGWGFIGVMWRRPVMITPVRTTRFTREFMERHDTWTLCAFPEEHRKDLELLGSRSGRDGDKLSQTGLTPVASNHVAAPGYAESVLTIECRTIYWNDITPEHMVDGTLDTHYAGDYHRMYYGEILGVLVAE